MMGKQVGFTRGRGRSKGREQNCNQRKQQEKRAGEAGDHNRRKARDEVKDAVGHNQ